MERSQPTARKISLFDYVDYRAYLRDFIDWRQTQNAGYSMSAFIRKAGLSKNSRGLFKRVADGQRNLTVHTLRGFTEALNLTAREALYFENLVYFNQAKRTKDRAFYLGRLEAVTKKGSGEQFELLQNQHLYYSKWYFVAIRELVALDDFRPEIDWIHNQLNEKVSKPEITQALALLERMQLVKVSKEGRWAQSDPLVKIPRGIANGLMDEFHVDMLKQAEFASHQIPHAQRSLSSVTLSCDQDSFPEILKMIEKFRDRIVSTFGVNAKKVDAVYQLSVQLFPLNRIVPKKKDLK